MNEKRLLELAKQAKQMPEQVEGMHNAEPGAKYHAFMGLLAKELQPKRIVELGSYIGETTKYMASMAPKATVVAVDINPDAMRQNEQVAPTFPNIKAFTDDAIHYAQLYDREPIDLLFIDINHDFSSTMTAYNSWKDFVRDGGIIAVDDIHLDTETEKFNEYLHDLRVQLIDIPGIHATGFGIIVKES